jgi:serine protease Do
MDLRDENKIPGRTAGLLLALAAAFAVGCAQIDVPENTAPSKPSVNPAPTRVVPSGAPETAVVSYSDVVKRVSPAVVTIQSERRTRAPRQFPFLDDPRFRERFGGEAPAPPQPRGRVQRGLGSGVVVSADGYILTNHHVVDGADQIRVGFANRQTYEARVVGSDPPSDLAVLKIAATDLPELVLGNSDAVEVGDVVLAVGNPLGLEQTVTAGIISAKGRSTGVSDGSFEDFLQTDAPINQGNSGGALVNTAGEVIGINSQILSPTGGNIGIGFAIPSNMARNVMEQLIRTGDVRRGQLGVVVEPVTSDVAAETGLEKIRGVLVGRVQTGSAAERAGIRAGDIITAFNGETVNESNELRNRVATTLPGTKVTLTVFRDGRETQLGAELGELEMREKNDE